MTYITATTHLCSTKLNNTEVKLTGVPLHCFIIIRVKPWAWYFVAVLSLFLITDDDGPSLSRCQNKIKNLVHNNTVQQHVFLYIAQYIIPLLLSPQLYYFYYFEAISRTTINNACRMKTRHKRFWRPTNQNFDFKPSIFSLENNKF